MHELSIALSIAEVAAEEAARQKARVVAVHLKLGILAGVENEALVAAWEIAREKTTLVGAALVIEDLPCREPRHLGVFCASSRHRRYISTVSPRLISQQFQPAVFLAIIEA